MLGSLLGRMLGSLLDRIMGCIVSRPILVKNSLGPNANYVDLGGFMPNNTPKVSWRTKPRARVFDVDS